MFEIVSLPKRMRLHRAHDFKRILSERYRVLGKEYILRFAQNKIKFPRVAVIVSRKSVPLAVIRNQAKRIVREAFRCKQHELGNYDLIVQIQKFANQSNKSELRRCIDELLDEFIKRCKH